MNSECLCVCVVCFFVCGYIYIYIRTYIYMCIYVKTESRRAYIYICVCIYIYVQTQPHPRYTHIDMCAHTRARTHTRACTHKYGCIYFRIDRKSPFATKVEAMTHAPMRILTQSLTMKNRAAGLFSIMHGFIVIMRIHGMLDVQIWNNSKNSWSTTAPSTHQIGYLMNDIWIFLAKKLRHSKLYTCDQCQRRGLLVLVLKFPLSNTLCLYINNPRRWPLSKRLPSNAHHPPNSPADDTQCQN